jgi:hypothetical protein
LKPEETGEQIGQYELLERIGHGAFGVVWVAEQIRPIRRRVALKVIKVGMDTKDVVARFEQERQALAMMDHPNIAKVLDAGALEKDRERRYETATDFARDIERHLSSEPVLARPPSPGYKLRKFARRNKVAIGVAAVLTAMLLAGTGVSLWQAKLAIAARKDADAKAASERGAREESEATVRFLEEVVVRPDPMRNGRAITVAESLPIAVKELERDRTISPRARARLEASIAGAYQRLGLVSDAIPLREKGADLLPHGHGQGASRHDRSHELAGGLLLASGPPERGAEAAGGNIYSQCF